MTTYPPAIRALMNLGVPFTVGGTREDPNGTMGHGKPVYRVSTEWNMPRWGDITVYGDRQTWLTVIHVVEYTKEGIDPPFTGSHHLIRVDRLTRRRLLDRSIITDEQGRATGRIGRLDYEGTIRVVFACVAIEAQRLRGAYAIDPGR